MSPPTSAPFAVDVTLRIDLGRREVAASLAAPVPISKLLKGLPGGGSLLGWLPDIDLDALGMELDLSSDGFGTFVTAGPADSAKPSAAVFVAAVPLADKSIATAAGLSVGSPIDLSGTPLFGKFLTGISIEQLGITYASAAIPANTIVLPPPAPAQQPALPSGLSLATTLTDGSSTSALVLTPAGVAPQHQDGALIALVGDDPTAGAPIQWFPVQKSFGPLTVGRIGAVTDGDRFGLALDASVATTALSVTLSGFTLTFPKDDVSLGGLKVALDGLGVAIKAGDFELAGSLVRNGQEYDGALVMQLGAYGVAAVGSYAEIEGATSLFVFGLVDGPFGGPPVCYVTGVAAGFGYNRALKLPTPAQVKDFPFVLMATQGGYLPDPSVANALQKLSGGGWVPPERGEYWVGAGLKFTSFEVVQSFALLTVEFGNELVIALLGVSAIALPLQGDGSPYAYAELEIDAVLEPSQGTFQLTALLSANSYVLDPACRLTGGFAFWLWFGDNDHAGDFVVTLGGYNPHFTPHPWYPDVPRLGFDWPMSSEIELRGGVYFALTPSCIMAGGGLSLSYDDGDLHAWFDAQADFIIYWRPFFFRVDISISVGASYRLNLGFTHRTVSAELGASVDLWGPPVRGVAHVHWWVISFSVDINGGGDPPQNPTVVAAWSTFEDSFLPPGARTPVTASGIAPLPQPTSSVTRPRASSGLLGTVQDGPDPVWLVTAESLALATETVVPATQVSVTGPTPDKDRTFDGPAVGVYPMAAAVSSAVHTVALYPWVDGAPGKTAVDLSAWSWDAPPRDFPQSLWGTGNPGQAELGAEVVSGLGGAAGTPPAPTLTGPGAFPLSTLHDDLCPRGLPLPQTDPADASTAAPTEDARTVIAATVTDHTVAATRADIVAAVLASGAGRGLVAGDLTRLAQDVTTTFPGVPMLGPSGSSGPKAPAGAAVVASRQRTRHRRSRPLRRTALCAVGRSAGAPGALRSWHGVHVLDPRSTAAERAVVYGARALYAGDTHVWSLAPGGGHAVVADGAAPLRVTAFDVHGRVLLDDDVVGTARVALPREATVAALTCATRRDGRQIAGWHGTSMLLQVAPQALLTDGAAVRPQAPQRRRSGRGTRGVGIVSGRGLLRGNLRAGHGAAEPGWTETALPDWTASVVVPLREGGAVAAYGGDGRPLRELGTIEDGDGGAVVYAAPGPRPCRVVVDGAGQDGVLGLRMDGAEVVERGGYHRPHDDGAPAGCTAAVIE